MTHPTALLAHDLGTTGNKATLFDAATGAALAAVHEPYATAYPQPGWAEQDPADWAAAIYRGSRRLLAEAGLPPGAIAAVSFSGMMNGALLLDAQGEPLRPAIIWADQRATAEADLLAERAGREAVYRLTGSLPGAAYTAAKVAWIRRRQPEVYARAAHVLQAKDYAACLLSGAYATDYSDASNTGLFDIARRAWAGEMFETLELDAGRFPPVHPSTAVVGRVTRAAAAATGLLAGTPVVIGGGDGACATVGAGAVRPGDAYTYLGSSSWIAVTARQPLIDPLMRTFTLAHLDPALYFPIGAMQAAGGAFDWVERLLRGDEPGRGHDALAAAAAAVPAGARGLLFLPHLIGERSPYWNPRARAAFVGLTMAHGRPEMARAVLEGVALNLRLILDALRDQAAGITAMRLIGGGARSGAWRQILADVFGLPIVRPALAAEATSLGAAIAGGIGVGLYRDFTVADRFVRVSAGEQPDAGAVAVYAGLLPLFREAYAALDPIHARL